MRLLVSENIWDFDLDAAMAAIPQQRREQAMKFRHESGRRQCVLAYQLLCQGLSEEFGFTEQPLFDYGEHGKPFVVGRNDLHFSLSHCREAVCCAVSRSPVGVDVESVRRFSDSLVRYTMNADEEACILSASQPAVEFIRLWTMKESLLKLTGEGITRDLKTVLTDSHHRFTTTVATSGQYVLTVCE